VDPVTRSSWPLKSSTATGGHRGRDRVEAALPVRGGREARPLNHGDAWFDYVRLEESVGDRDRIREVYERAIANVPAEEKRLCSATSTSGQCP